MIIGLTGAYCAGKNFIGSMLEAKGLPVLDVDKLGYLALEAEKETIFKQFGADLQKSDGTVDRRLLGQRVFGNADKLAALEAIVHPAANKMTEEWISQNEGNAGKTACVINAALLHRSSVFEKLDCIIIVTAPFLTRLLRAKKRDKLSWAEIFKRFASQKGFDINYLSKNAEIYKVGNSGFFYGASRGNSGRKNKKLEKKIDSILKRIR